MKKLALITDISINRLKLLYNNINKKKKVIYNDKQR